MNKYLISSLLFSFFISKNTSVFCQKNTENESVISLIKKRRRYNKSNGAEFKIQLYNGLEKRAKNIKANFEREFYWINTKLEFESPDWKVQVGNYKTRLDADKALNKIREKFSGAIIIEK